MTTGLVVVQRLRRPGMPVRGAQDVESHLLDMRLFHHRGFSGAVLTILGLTGLVYFFFQFFQFLQLARQRSPLAAGLFTVPTAVGAVRLRGAPRGGRRRLVPTPRHKMAELFGL